MTDCGAVDAPTPDELEPPGPRRRTAALQPGSHGAKAPRRRVGGVRGRQDPAAREPGGRRTRARDGVALQAPRRRRTAGMRSPRCDGPAVRAHALLRRTEPRPTRRRPRRDARRARMRSAAASRQDARGDARDARSRPPPRPLPRRRQAEQPAANGIDDIAARLRARGADAHWRMQWNTRLRGSGVRDGNAARALVRRLRPRSHVVLPAHGDAAFAKARVARCAARRTAAARRRMHACVATRSPVGGHGGRGARRARVAP